MILVLVSTFILGCCLLLTSDLFIKEPTTSTPVTEDATEILGTETITTELNEPIVIDPDKPMIALTFDDGPCKHTERLLDILAQYRVKATFFVIGNQIEIDNRPETLKRIVAEGHEIGAHSWSHRDLTTLSSEDIVDEIMNTRMKIQSITGVDTRFLRPPYGAYNNETKRICAEHYIVMINWSLDTLDWETCDADKVYEDIMNQVKDGNIILCHDLYGTTVDAMERVIPDLIAQGYQLVTVSELLSYGEYEIKPGTVHNKQ